jgi:alpha-tubulin suppressor-like RCC1 family protein
MTSQNNQNNEMKTGAMLTSSSVAGQRDNNRDRSRSGSMNNNNVQYPNKHTHVPTPRSSKRRGAGAGFNNNSRTNNHHLILLKKRDKHGRTLLHRLASTGIGVGVGSSSSSCCSAPQRLGQLDRLLRHASANKKLESQHSSNADMSELSSVPEPYSLLRELLTAQDMESGCTALHRALYEGNLKSVLLLLRHAARADALANGEDVHGDGGINQRQRQQSYSYRTLMEQHITPPPKNGNTSTSSSSTSRYNKASMLRGRPRSNSAGADKILNNNATSTTKSSTSSSSISICIVQDMLSQQDQEGLRPLAFMGEVCASAELDHARHYLQLWQQHYINTGIRNDGSNRTDDAHAHDHDQFHADVDVDDEDPMPADEDGGLPSFGSRSTSVARAHSNNTGTAGGFGVGGTGSGWTWNTDESGSRYYDPRIARWGAPSGTLNSNSSAYAYGTELVTFGSKDHAALGQFRSSSSSHHQSSSAEHHQQEGVVLGRVEEFAAIHPNPTDANTDAHANDHAIMTAAAVKVAVGAQHTMVVNTAGQLYAFGLGKGGRLGLGMDQKTFLKPERVMGLLATKFVVNIAAAESHSLCTTSQGEVFAWGSNRFGQLGVMTGHHKNKDKDNKNGSSAGAGAAGASTMIVATPVKVMDDRQLRKEFIVDVAAGDRHSVCLSRDGQVFCFGCNKFGQLGCSDNTSRLVTQYHDHVHTKPLRVDALWLASSSNSNNSSSKIVTKIAASDKSTLVLTKPATSKDGRSRSMANGVYSWGNGNYLPLRVNFPSDAGAADDGQQDNKQVKVRVPVVSRHKIVNPVAIACAKYHNVAISSDGEVYTWGLSSDATAREQPQNKPKQEQESPDGFVTVGISSSSSSHNNNKKHNSHSYSSSSSSYRKMSSPRLVVGMSPCNIAAVGGGKAVAVSASEHHTAVVTSHGHLYTWGASNYGNRVLGHKGTKYQPTPKRVAGVFRALDVKVSREHTALLLGTTFPSLPSPVSVNVNVNVNVGLSSSLHQYPSDNNSNARRGVPDATGTDTDKLLPVLVRVPVPSLQALCERAVASQMDLFNAIPTLLTAERLHAQGLVTYGAKFIQHNLDGVLALAKQRHLDTLLDEGLMYYNQGADDYDCQVDHIMDDATRAAAGRDVVDDDTWLLYQCLGDGTTSTTKTASMAMSSSSRSILQRKVSFCRAESTATTTSTSQVHNMSSMEQASIIGGRDKSSRPSLRAVQLARDNKADLTNSNPAQVLARYDSLAKACRSIKKKFNVIADYQYKEEVQANLLSQEQQQKLARQPELEADLALLQPLLEAATFKMEHFNLFTAAYPRRKVSNAGTPLLASTATTANNDAAAVAVGKGPAVSNTNTDGVVVVDDVAEEQLQTTFRCSACDLACPNKTSLTLHLSGRKHRNRQRRLREEENAATHTAIVKGQQEATMAHPAKDDHVILISSARRRKVEAYCALQSDSSSAVSLSVSKPRYSLAPKSETAKESSGDANAKQTSTAKASDWTGSIIPRKTQASHVQRSLQDIMKEEEQRTAAKSTPKKSPAAPPGSTLVVTTSPWSSKAGSASVNNGSPAPIPIPGAKLPAFKGWSISSSASNLDEPISCNIADVWDNHCTAKATLVQPSKAATQTEVSSPAPMPSFSLADLMDQNAKKKKKQQLQHKKKLAALAENATPTKAAAWGGTTPVSTSTPRSAVRITSIGERPDNSGLVIDDIAASDSAVGRRKISFSAVSLSEIQQKEEEFKSKADTESGIIKGKWHIERRERAGSMGEIQRKHEEDRQMVILIEEQRAIEDQIARDNALATAAAASKQKKQLEEQQRRKRQKKKQQQQVKEKARQHSNKKNEQASLEARGPNDKKQMQGSQNQRSKKTDAGSAAHRDGSAAKQQGSSSGKGSANGQNQRSKKTDAGSAAHPDGSAVKQQGSSSGKGSANGQHELSKKNDAGSAAHPDGSAVKQQGSSSGKGSANGQHELSKKNDAGSAAHPDGSAVKQQGSSSGKGSANGTQTRPRRQRRKQQTCMSENTVTPSGGTSAGTELALALSASAVPFCPPV